MANKILMLAISPIQHTACWLDPAYGAAGKPSEVGGHGQESGLPQNRGPLDPSGCGSEWWEGEQGLITVPAALPIATTVALCPHLLALTTLCWSHHVPQARERCRYCVLCCSSSCVSMSKLKLPELLLPLCTLGWVWPTRSCMVWSSPGHKVFDIPIL